MVNKDLGKYNYGHNDVLADVQVILSLTVQARQWNSYKVRGRALCSGGIFSKAIRITIFSQAFFYDGVALQLAWITVKGFRILVICVT